MTLALTKLSETAQTITLGWTPPPGIGGYVFYADAQAVSTGSPNLKDGTPRKEVKFHKTAPGPPFQVAAVCRQSGIFLLDVGTYSEAPPPPPPPPPGAIPSVITGGGTYSGTLKVNQSGSAVKIQTSAPVVIENALIENLGDGGNIECFQAGAQVTIRNTVLNGGQWRAINARDFKSFRVENCTVNKTWGCRFDNMQSGGTLHFLRNKGRNTQWIREPSHFFQCANNPQGVTIEVAWNEAINEFGQSSSEDVISSYSSHGAKIHDNYVQGAYPLAIGDGYSGGGIIVDGPDGSGNELYDNIVVDTVNYGVALAGGRNGTCRNNRAVSDGKAPNGQRFAAANIGLYVADFSNTPSFTGNQAFGNVVGWTKADGARNDSWLPGCQGQCSNSSLKSGAITQADKDAEWQRWLSKKLAAGVTVGA